MKKENNPFTIPNYRVGVNLSDDQLLDQAITIYAQVTSEDQLLRHFIDRDAFILGLAKHFVSSKRKGMDWVVLNKLVEGQ